MAASYQLIQSYLDHFEQLNPGSIAVVERDGQNRFMRAMVSVKGVTDSLEVNQRVLGVDCAHSKCPWYDGVQMTLVGQDGNRETTIIAFALVPSEDLLNYDWFFGRLLDAGLNIRGSILFCDRDAAMMSVADTLSLNTRYCTLHIIRNVTSRFKTFTKEHRNMVWRLQAAETEEASLKVSSGPNWQWAFERCHRYSLFKQCAAASSIGSIQHRVTLSKNHCTCAFIDQHRLPCRHMIAALQSRGKLDTVFDYFDKVYLVSSYAEAFEGKVVHLPLNQEVVADALTLPPVLTAKRGRPKTKRIRSRGEEGRGSNYRCSGCGGPGHNRQTCKRRKNGC